MIHDTGAARRYERWPQGPGLILAVVAAGVVVTGITWACAADPGSARPQDAEPADRDGIACDPPPQHRQERF